MYKLGNFIFWWKVEQGKSQWTFLHPGKKASIVFPLCFPLNKISLPKIVVAFFNDSKTMDRRQTSTEVDVAMKAERLPQRQEGENLGGLALPSVYSSLRGIKGLIACLQSLSVPMFTKLSTVNLHYFPIVYIFVDNDNVSECILKTLKIILKIRFIKLVYGKLITFVQNHKHGFQLNRNMYSILFFQT